MVEPDYSCKVDLKLWKIQNLVTTVMLGVPLSLQLFVTPTIPLWEPTGLCTGQWLEGTSSLPCLGQQMDGLALVFL